MKMKLGALIAVTALLSACGGNDAASKPETGPVDLRMTVWSANDAHLKLFNDIAAEYKTTHPNVSVKFDPIPFDSYTTTLTTQIAGNNGPDLAWVLEGSAPDFVNSGALVPLDGKLEAVDDIVPATTKLW
jgi:multiple sugar transport system substrate-binding protein